MEIDFIKHPGGSLAPANDYAAEAMNKVRSGETVTVSLKRYRNPNFHRKVFSFFKYCFDHWASDREFMDEPGQFDVFRKNLTVMAGYYNQYVNIRGEVRIEAKSLAYGNMDQDEFEMVYNALIAAAMKHIFKGCGEDVENRLLEFF